MAGGRPSTEYMQSFINPDKMSRVKFSSAALTPADPSVRRPFERSISSTNLMSDWMRRTKAMHAGGNDRFAQVAQSYDPYLEQQKKIPPIPTEEEYKRTYKNLMQKLASRRSQSHLNRKMPSGGKGGWRHIRESYAAGTNVVSWLDGAVSLEDSGIMQRPVQVQSRFSSGTCGGKGPNRNIKETYGAGTTNIAWIDGLRNVQKVERPQTTIVALPRIYRRGLESKTENIY